MTGASKPQISVVIPTYNQASLLRLALQSVVDQKFQDWEALVINNYSSDNTEEVVASFKDPRISLTNFANHGVIAASRNVGIRKAVGTYVAFLDSDDTWFPEKLGECIELIQKNQADAACHDELQVRNGQVERTLEYGPENRFDYLTMLFHGNCVSTSALVIRRDRLVEANLFSEEKSINTAEDYDLWMRLARNGCKFIFPRKALGTYLIHSANNSGAVSRHFTAILSVTQNHFDLLLQEKTGLARISLFLRRQLRIATLFYGAGRHAQSQGLKKESMMYFLKSLSLNPFRLKTFVGLAILMVSPPKGQRHA
jgi:GT2 family glycosyltransferase